MTRWSSYNVKLCHSNPLHSIYQLHGFSTKVNSESPAGVCVASTGSYNRFSCFNYESNDWFRFSKTMETRIRQLQTQCAQAFNEYFPCQLAQVVTMEAFHKRAKSIYFELVKWFIKLGQIPWKWPEVAGFVEHLCCSDMTFGFDFEFKFCSMLLTLRFICGNPLHLCYVRQTKLLISFARCQIFNLKNIFVPSLILCTGKELTKLFNFWLYSD